MHAAALDFVRRVVRSSPPLTRVLEIGSKNWNGTARAVFPDAKPPNGKYVGLDLEAGDCVDVVADAAAWVPTERFHAVACCEVFEHTDKGPEICRTARAALLPGGVFAVTCASPLRGVHGHDGGGLKPGEHYAGVTGAELAGWLDAAGFDLVAVSPSPADDTHAVAWASGRVYEKPVGICVITYNRLECLKQVVAGVRTHTRRPYRLVVASDGSTDGTREWLAGQTDLAYVAPAARRGCGWTRNRGIYALATRTDCDEFIHLEDDAAPCENGWESRWCDAVPNKGFIAYAFKDGRIASGSDEPHDPYVANTVGMQCCSFDRNLLDAVGYSDPLFFPPYGHEDTEWRWRFYRAFGGRRVPVGGPALHRGVRLLDAPSGFAELSCALNGLILDHVAGLPMPRPPWRTDEQKRLFLEEQRGLVAPAGWADKPPGDA